LLPDFNLVLILAFICCFLLGLLVGFWIKDSENTVIGRFLMNTDPKAEHMFEIVFDKDLDEFTRKRQVTFELVKR
jgi:hypothetical protein